MKKSILFCIIIFMISTASCSKNKTNVKVDIIATENNENEIEVIEENLGKLELLKPILEIKIGTDRNIVEDKLNEYNITESDDNSLSCDLYKNRNILFQEDANEEIQVYCDFDENQKLKSIQLDISGSLETEISKKVTYNYYRQLSAFVKNYTKAKPEAFHIDEENLRFPIIDYWKLKNEKVLLAVETFGMFGMAEFISFSISKICN